MSYFINTIFLLSFLYISWGLFRIFSWPVIKTWLFEYVSSSIKLDFFYKPDNVEALRYFILLVLFVGSLLSYLIYFDIWDLATAFGLSTNTSNENSLANKNAVIGLIMTVAITIAGWLYTSKIQLINSIKQHTLTVLLDSRLSEEYMKNAYYVNELFTLNSSNNHKISIQDVRSLRPSIEDEMKYRHAIFYILNYFEFIAIAVRNRDLDEFLLKSSWQSIVVSNCNFFSQLIIDLQTEKDTHFKNLVALHKRWS